MGHPQNKISACQMSDTQSIVATHNICANISSHHHIFKYKPHNIMTVEYQRHAYLVSRAFSENSVSILSDTVKFTTSSDPPSGPRRVTVMAALYANHAWGSTAGAVSDALNDDLFKPILDKMPVLLETYQVWGANLVHNNHNTI